MKTKFGRLLMAGGVLALLVALLLAFGASADNELTPLEELGSFLYFDTDLSTPTGQACASCHDPDFGFVDPDSDLPVSQGVLPRLRFGNRNSPASAYAMYSPIFHFDDAEELWVGGLFWDGRATGDVLGDPLADQALGPFLNPLEMNNPSKLIVVESVILSDYADLFREVWGELNLQNVEAAYDEIALSIAAFERTELFAQFDSKYDAYLQACMAEGGVLQDCANGVGEAAFNAGVLNETEFIGLQLFVSKGQCAACHVTDVTEADAYGLPIIAPEWANGQVPPVFTDATFDNLGVPANPDNPFLKLPPAFNPDGKDFVDYGLGAFLKNSGYIPEVYDLEMGKHKVMSLRNIGLTAPYMHNGVFATLEEVVHFYNTRDVEVWPPPEVPMNVNVNELGNLELTPGEEAAIVAFMLTLSDGYVP
jgi:cytochrome c peroxidase